MSEQEAKRVTVTPMITLAEHHRKMKEQRNELYQMIGDLNSSVNREQQKSVTTQNKFNALTNVFKGFLRWSPDSYKDAIYMVDYLFLHTMSILNMYKKIHQKGQWGPLQVIAVIATVLILGGLMFTPYGGQFGAWMQSNSLLVVTILAFAAFFLFMMKRRSSNRPVQ